MPKESQFKELIDRLKVPGYLEKFERFFQKTPRSKTIPDMLRKRLGLYDGKPWFLKQISDVTPCLDPHHKFRKYNSQAISVEQVRQNLIKGYQIILKNEDNINE